MHRHLRWTAIAGLAALSLLTTACASASPGTGTSPTDEPTADASPLNGRVAVAYAGGIAVLDGTTLDIVAELPSDEFTRLNSFGDGKTIAVTTATGFQMLDTTTPALTDVVFTAAAPGHVVAHHGKTVLFDDGTGTTTILDTDMFADAYDKTGRKTTHTSNSPHHGVSIVLEDGTLLTTVGTTEGRSGVVALEPHDDHYHPLASSDQCPGIHGEGTAAGETVIFGCEDGALMFSGGTFTKLTAPDAYGRMGNVFTSATSPLAVGDYKNDPNAEGYLLSAVALIDTEKKAYQVVTLPEEIRYTFRDVARGPGDMAYILSTDGQIHVLDPATGDITAAFPVIDSWNGPVEWQDAHPAIKVNGTLAYVTEPATNSVHAVDLTSGAVVASVQLDHTPNELAVAGNG